MRTNRITRRDCARLLGLAALPATAREPYVLENSAVRFEIAPGDRSLGERRFINKLANESCLVRTPDFLLEFADGATLSAADCSVRPGASAAGKLQVLFSQAAGPLSDVEVAVDYHLPGEKPYVRKEISVRKRAGAEARLMRADLEDWTGVKRPWQSMRADRLRYGSHPVFCDNLWAGVEFVAAFNDYDSGGFVLRSRPGGLVLGPTWLPLHPTIIGAAETGRVREAFLEYLEDVRLAAPRLVACYNSWWTLPKVVKQADNLALIRDLKAKLFDRHGVFFDIITTDMGWSNPRSIWQIDRSILPQGFDDIRGIVEPAGGKLGLWMSPSEVYPPVCDYDWAEKNGFVVLWSNRDRSGRKRFAISLADPKYRNEVKAQLKALIRESNLAHIKYDGFVAEEDKPHHGLLPGPDSVEPLAAHSLELIQASKEQNPGLVTEPTYMNSLANYISPWILKYSDSVWGNSGGDCPLGIGPAPDYRESHTNAREYYIFSSLNEFWLPQNAVHYFDIVHCDSGEGFPNHAAMTLGRGRFFVSTYLNPKFMSEDDWRIYAGLLKWARANRDILRHTLVLPSHVELGEPYVYAHWQGARGILAVRNPSNESREFAIDLAKAGAPRDLAQAVCYSQYPCRKGIATDLGRNSTLALRLEPWELVFLEILPRAALQEPVAIGGRWYRDGAQTTGVVPECGVDRVRVLHPREGEQSVAVTPRQAGNLQAEVTAESCRRLPEGEWLSVKEQRFPTAAFELECSLEIPPGVSRGKVLLLVQFPGREHRPSRCAARLNGNPITLHESSSAGHIGYRLSDNDKYWKDIRPHECEWTWYICEVDSGSSRIRFAGAAGHVHPRIGLWVWCEQDLAASKVAVPVNCPEPAMPQYRQMIERRGIAVKRPVQVI